ncbi:MAG: 3-oxoacyl-ACP synthase III family protein [Planctomycetota bacterium]
MAKAYISAIEYYLPELTLTNEELAHDFPEWNAEKISSKTGIVSRHIAAPTELASDLAVAAAQKLFAAGQSNPQEIDYILLCTQSPDYLLPTSACLIQDRLGIPTSAGALDFNLGCSGFVYGLGLAKGLVETGQARCVLLLTAETYSKHLDANDISVRALFGDGAAATVIRAQDGPGDPSEDLIGPITMGTDGSGWNRLILKRGSLRESTGPQNTCATALHMNGPDIFAFTLREVPRSVQALLDRTGFTLADIDLFVFHQANRFMLENLRKKLQIPVEKFFYAIDDCGNTVSSTIPIALKRAVEEGRLVGGERVMLVGFGVGYSWSAAVLRWVNARDVA